MSSRRTIINQAMNNLILAIAVGSFLTSAASAGPSRPGRPKPKQVIFNPDIATCQSNVIRQAYERQLLPWKGQPKPVFDRLKIVQTEMTRSTLRRCQNLGLLDSDQVKALERQLALPKSSMSGSGERP